MLSLQFLRPQSTCKTGAYSRESLDADGTLEARCARVLFERARAQGGGSRQQVRAAVRRFLRCHRGNASYLRWVLGHVIASSTLAVTLLGLGVEPAQAASPTFTQLTGASNPLDGEGVGIASSPALGDLDGDGDLDLVVGRGFNDFGYFENVGSAISPVFVERTGAASPLDGMGLAYTYTTLSLGDLDGDGDLDFFAGENFGRFIYFENTGSATIPAFVERTGAANPLDGEFVNFLSTPALGDLDGDGDLDLLAGNNAGTFIYYENTGSAISPTFLERTGVANPLDGEDVGFYSTLALGDLDGDGDLDLLAGEETGTFLYYENTGSATDPVFVERTGTGNPLDGEVAGNFVMPTLGDLDGDGDLELVVGELYGTLLYYENSSVAPSRSAVELTGAANPLDGEDAGAYSAPALGDLDGDGDFDLFVGEKTGSFLYYENTGSSTNPTFVERTGAANPLDGEDAGTYAAPTLGDLDADGDLDLFVAELTGTFLYYENTGSATSPTFVERTGVANPLDGVDVGDNSTSALGDLDGDGDLDFFAGEKTGTFFYYENTGSAISPTFVKRSGSLNPLNGEDVGSFSSPALNDLDDDGDLDFIAGEEGGAFFYYENTGSATFPTFVERTGTASPFDGKDVGSFSFPTMSDLDADGDPDLIAGRQSGAFNTYYLPEPAMRWLLAAGLVLLPFLNRLRGRRS